MEGVISHLESENVIVTQNSQKEIVKVKEQYGAKTSKLEEQIEELQIELAE